MNYSLPRWKSLLQILVGRFPLQRKNPRPRHLTTTSRRQNLTHRHLHHLLLHPHLTHHLRLLAQVHLDYRHIFFWIVGFQVGCVVRYHRITSGVRLIEGV